MRYRRPPAERSRCKAEHPGRHAQMQAAPRPALNIETVRRKGLLQESDTRVRRSKECLPQLSLNQEAHYGKRREKKRVPSIRAAARWFRRFCRESQEGAASFMFSGQGGTPTDPSVI